MTNFDAFNQFLKERLCGVAEEIFRAVQGIVSEQKEEIKQAREEIQVLRRIVAAANLEEDTDKPVISADAQTSLPVGPDQQESRTEPLNSESSLIQVKLEVNDVQQNTEPQLVSNNTSTSNSTTNSTPPAKKLLPRVTSQCPTRTKEHEALQINSFISISLMPCDSQLVFNNSSVVLNPSLGSPHVEGVKVKDTHSCPYCNTAFDDLSQLASHLECHKYTDPYLCQICGKRFTRRVNWKKHMIVHQGLRPFQCKFCGKGFNQKCHLTEHERVHTGEKPFSCSVCGQRFTQFNHVRKHVRIIHRDKLQTMERPNTEGFFLNTDFF
ncbi:zinc finger protein 70-like isoform X2 [Astyanax mexicanus]|uniref:Zinc finger protein 70-like isoform X2 n=1 Tax=Astyanax mexicanus TaxID=7994 RepID=A0A8T2KUS5_ASTMX|nr:zinc finger protein 70-like isoform X2 [Astyanax mexicanus]